MFRNKTNKKNDSKATSTEIARQDPRTKVHTTVAQTQTVNTTVQNATIFNEGAGRVTYQTVTQTVTHHEMAGITEIQTRRTATPEELEAFLASLNLESEQNNLPATRLISKNESPTATTSKTKSATKAAPRANTQDKKKNPENTTKTPTAASSSKLLHFHTEETTVTQNRGYSFSSNVQEQRIELKPNRRAPNKSTTTSKAATDEPYSAKRVWTPISSNNNSYTSPYTKRTVVSTDAKPFETSNNLIASRTKPPQINRINYPPASNALKASATTSSLPSIRGYQTKARSLGPSPSLPSIARSVGKMPKSKLKPGIACILNNEEFDDIKNEYRFGSSADVKALLETFEYFKLKVEVHNNLKLNEIRTLVKKLEKKDFTDISCLVFVILSHGHRYERVLARNRPYTIDDDVLFKILRNPTLVQKPKIFFIQACKGSMEIGDLHTDAQQPSGPPLEVLKCYSTFEGFVSYRTENGSIFVQKLCENIKRDGKTKSIDEIMKDVTRSVKIISKHKQIPTITSTLTKPFVFGDYV